MCSRSSFFVIVKADLELQDIIHCTMGYLVFTFFDRVRPENASLKYLNLLFGLTSWSDFAPRAFFQASISNKLLTYSDYATNISFYLARQPILDLLAPSLASSAALSSSAPHSDLVSSQVTACILLIHLNPLVSSFSRSSSSTSGSQTSQTMGTGGLLNALTPPSDS